MHTQIQKPLERVWKHHRSKLEEALDESIRALQNLLRLDEYHRHGHEEAQLEQNFGPFASASLNLSSLSKVLSKSGNGRGLPKDRVQRIERLLDSLQSHRNACSGNPDPLPSIDLSEDESVIHEQAEAHLNRMADIFRNIRMTQLELRAKYNAVTHDPVFEAFSWRDMSPNELSLCAPFVITAELENEYGPALRKILSLLESRKPFKVFVLRSGLRKAYSPISDTGVPASLAIEMIPLAMRGTTFLQTCQAVPDCDQRIFNALTSPHPGLISLLAQKPTESTPAFEHRARCAMRSRAFPVLAYDPDLAPGFVTCFDLSGNPDSGDDYTYAHYALEQEDCKEEFTIPDPGAAPGDLVDLPEYLKLLRRQRVGKIPCIKINDTDGREVVKVVSPAIVTQTSDLLHLWKSLLEISGLDNPHIKSTEANLEEHYGAQQKALIASLEKEMEQTHLHRERVAVAAAVRQLVARFTGVDASEIDLQQLIENRANKNSSQ